MHNIPLQLSMEVKKHDRGSEEGKKDREGHSETERVKGKNQKDKTERETSGEGILRPCYSEKVMLLSQGSRCAFHSPGARS